MMEDGGRSIGYLSNDRPDVFSLTCTLLGPICIVHFVKLSNICFRSAYVELKMLRDFYNFTSAFASPAIAYQ